MSSNFTRYDITDGKDQAQENPNIVRLFFSSSQTHYLSKTKSLLLYLLVHKWEKEEKKKTKRSLFFGKEINQL